MRILVILLFAGSIASLVLVLVTNNQQDWNPVLPTADYAPIEEGGCVEPRRCPEEAQVTGGQNPRSMSNLYFKQAPQPTPDEGGLSMLAVVLGQFLVHDFTLAENDPAELPIVVPVLDPGDPFLPVVTQINVSRIRLAQGQIISFQTPLVDLSQVYGASAAKTAQLWDHATGDLLLDQNKHLIVVGGNGLLAGDPRAPEWMGLTALHTVFSRYHNHWAAKVRHARPAWSPEDVFRKARQISTAVYQKIIYEDWFRAIHARGYTRQQVRDLADPSQPWPHPQEDLALAGNIWTDFSSTFLRFGHSMIPNEVGGRPLKDLFGRADLVRSEGTGVILGQMASTRAKGFRAELVDGLRETLFGSFGLDLATFNLARGRDVGIPSYEDMARCLGRQPEGVGKGPDAFLGMLQEQPALAQGASTGGIVREATERQLFSLARSDPLFYTRNPDLGYREREHIGHVTLRDVLVEVGDLDGGAFPGDVLFAPQ